MEKTTVDDEGSGDVTWLVRFGMSMWDQREGVHNCVLAFDLFPPTLLTKELQHPISLSFEQYFFNIFLDFICINLDFLYYFIIY